MARSNYAIPHHNALIAPTWLANLFGADVNKNAATNCFANAGTCGSGDNLESISRDFLKKVK